MIGGNQKPWRQKGTGRARQGSTRAPQWVGGGTVFGPIPRSYAQYVPRQVRALARKSAFNARAREDAILVIDRFDYDAPKTSRLQALIDRLELADRKVLILTDGVKPHLFLSGRNLPTVHVMPYADVSTYHLLWSDVVLVEAGGARPDAGAGGRDGGRAEGEEGEAAAKDEALVEGRGEAGPEAGGQARGRQGPRQPTRRPGRRRPRSRRRRSRPRRSRRPPRRRGSKRCRPRIRPSFAP